ncbi:MAG: polysaccharide deacetylase family protein [Gaiellaceae bacterium]
MRGVALAVALLAAVLLCASAARAHTGPGPSGPTAVERFALAGKPVFCGGPSKRVFALTFDDGPSPWTESLVAALRRGRAPATFFMVGNRLTLWSSSARAAAGYRAGAIGDHTWSHADLDPLPVKQIEKQLLWAQQALHSRLGVRTQLFRPPYERANAKVERVVHRLGFLDVRWNVDPVDTGRGATPNRVVRSVLRNLRPGSIVLLHDLHPWTAQVVRRVLVAAKKRHLWPVTIPRLLEVDPPQPNESCFS